MQTRGCLGVSVWAQPTAKQWHQPRLQETLGLVAQPHVICGRFSCGVHDAVCTGACAICAHLHWFDMRTRNSQVRLWLLLVHVHLFLVNQAVVRVISVISL